MNKINFEYDEYFYQKIDLKENMNYKMEIKHCFHLKIKVI